MDPLSRMLAEMRMRNSLLHQTSPLVSLGGASQSRSTCASIGGREFRLPVDFVQMSLPLGSVTLPKGTTYKQNSLALEVDVPPVQPMSIPELERLISFQTVGKDMIDVKHRACLEDTPALNVIQSSTFDAAYKTDQNMLVCAPTGAGKTLIALLCVLRELTHYSNILELKRSPYKIVYIAPMKALACEIALNFNRRLESMGLKVREFTGDMHLYASEVENTDMLVTTPEKYDAVTRRDTGESSLFQTVHLLIVDEIHMLSSDRGPVLEAIIARMFRLREMGNSRLRIVGLSATLPNYEEIAQFLRVDPQLGLFYFGWGFRPIPLKQTFIAPQNTRFKQYYKIADEVCYKKTLNFVKEGKQVLIFLHSRAGTIKTAMNIENTAEKEGDLHHFYPVKDTFYSDGLKMVNESKIKKLQELYDVGIGFHHAGMLREDRQLMENLFRGGYIKVLVSTATLAWGVNLPAYAVIVKGTQLYSPSKGGMVNIDLLDVQQMFGRAGRPQYDVMGKAVLITHRLQLRHYLSLFQWTVPIQSQLHENLVDHLNAEVALSSVRSVEDGVNWLRHTFMYIRMKSDKPFYKVVGTVEDRCDELIRGAVLKLMASKMIIADVKMREISSTDVGRIASHSYICYETIRVINQFFELNSEASLANILHVLSKAKEFKHFKVRPDEGRELTSLKEMHCKEIPTKGMVESELKVIILLQSWLCRVEIKTHSIYLDQVFTSQNAGRILRAMFDIAVVKRRAIISRMVLTLRKLIMHKLLLSDHPIFQMKYLFKDRCGYMIAEKEITLLQLRALNLKQMVKIVQDEKVAGKICSWLKSVPFVDTEVTYHRTTPQLVQIQVKVTPKFVWKKSVNREEFEPFHVWVENKKTGVLYQKSPFCINSRQAECCSPITINICVALNDDEFQFTPTLTLRVISEYWLGVDVEHDLRSSDLAMSSGAKSVFSIIDETDVKGYAEAPLPAVAEFYDDSD